MKYVICNYLELDIPPISGPLVKLRINPQPLTTYTLPPGPRTPPNHQVSPMTQMQRLVEPYSTTQGVALRYIRILGSSRCGRWMLRDRPPGVPGPTHKYTGLRQADMLSRHGLDGGPPKQSSDFIRSK